MICLFFSYLEINSIIKVDPCRAVLFRSIETVLFGLRTSYIFLKIPNK